MTANSSAGGMRRDDPVIRGRGDDEGAVAYTVIIVVALVLIGVAALVVDLGSLFAERRQLQTAADSAALAAVQDLGALGVLVSNPAAASPATDRARSYVSANLAGAQSAVRYESASAGGLFYDTIKVTATVPESPHFFARIWGDPSSEVAAAATARVRTPAAVGGLLPIGVVGDPSQPNFGFTAGASTPIIWPTNANGPLGPGNAGWITLNYPPTLGGNQDKWSPHELVEVLHGGGTSGAVYMSLYPVETGTKMIVQNAFVDWYDANKDPITGVASALVPLIDSSPNGSSDPVQVIGFARFDITEEPFTVSRTVNAEFVRVVPLEELTLSPYWPSLAPTHVALTE